MKKPYFVLRYLSGKTNIPLSRFAAYCELKRARARRKLARITDGYAVTDIEFVLVKIKAL